MINDSTIAHLVVTHRTGPSATHESLINGDCLRVVTCQREVEISLALQDAATNRDHDGIETLFGVDAYRRLLEITTGLLSEIPAETNVFGQFRRAWETFSAHRNTTTTADLTPVMQRLFQDTRTIRRHWLQGIGGHSYGSLVRRLMAPRPAQRVLFVGAGNLMQSMLPLFDKYQLGVWNRNPIASPASAEILFTPEQGEQAACWAEHVVLTTPPDPANDHQWRLWLEQSGPHSIFHLGHRDAGWLADSAAAGPTAYTLADLYQLQNELRDFRASRLHQARLACAQLAGMLNGTKPIGLIAA